MTQARWWAVLHLLLTLLAPFLLFSLIGCDTEFKGEPVDYGPAQPEDKVLGSLVNLFRDSHPEKTTVNSGSRFITTQDAGGGAYKAIVSATSLIVSNRVETTDTVTLSLVQDRITIRDNQIAQKLNREFDIAFAKNPNFSAALDPNLPQQASKALQALKAHALELGGGTKASTMATAPATYHRLGTWEDHGAPPTSISGKSNCNKLPNCQITYRHMKFDIVYWDQPQGDPVHVELITSPDIPQTSGYDMTRFSYYIPGLLRSCVSQMVAVGTEGMKTLLSECEEVDSFHIE